MQIDHENISASFRSKIYSSPLTAAVHLFYLRVFSDNLSPSSGSLPSPFVICFPGSMPKRTGDIPSLRYYVPHFKYILIVPNHFIYNDEKRCRILRISRRTSPMTTNLSRVNEPANRPKTGIFAKVKKISE